MSLIHSFLICKMEKKNATYLIRLLWGLKQYMLYIYIIHYTQYTLQCTLHTMPTWELIFLYYKHFIFIEWILASDEALELCPLPKLRIFRKNALLKMLC